MRHPISTPIPELQDTAPLARKHPSPAEMADAQAIVDSLPVITCYASCEWNELHDDGKIWIAAIIKAARQKDAS